MSEVVTETTETPKQGSKKLLIIIVLAVVLLGGGGAGAYFFLFASKTTEGSEETKKSSKKAKADEEEEEPEDKSDKKSGSLKSSLPKDENVKKIIELQPFIVNLADENEARYLRLTVSLGVGGAEGGEEKPDQLFVTRVRNAMLAVLSEKKSEEILTVEGKAKLRKELLKAAQAASEEPHVEAIYITDFIVQL